jgi:hypothetical protein
VDARICYAVELKRQRNKWLNLCLYACIGLSKYFQRIRTTSQAISTFQSGHKGEVENSLDASKEQPLLSDKSYIVLM